MLADTARCALMNIPEAIQHPRGLALGGSWSVLSGPHLTFTASEDFLANGHGGSANHSFEGMMNAKTDLRKKLRKSRQDIHKNRYFWEECQPALVESISRYFTSGQCIAGYIAVGSEVDPAPLMARATAQSCAMALPFVATREAPMCFREWQIGEPLERADFGFSQPLASAAFAAPDIIIVPLVGFDRMMNRLGQGAGHYDHVFPAFPRALRIGLAWSVQEVQALSIDRWDVPLDFILTERELICAPNPRTFKT